MSSRPNEVRGEISYHEVFFATLWCEIPRLRHVRRGYARNDKDGFDILTNIFTNNLTIEV